MGKGEVADGAVPLDGDLEHGCEVVTVLRRDGGRLLPLAVKAVVDQGVIGINGGGIGTVSPRTTRTGAATLGGEEGVLGIGVSLALSLAG